MTKKQCTYNVRKVQEKEGEDYVVMYLRRHYNSDQDAKHAFAKPEASDTSSVLV